MSRPGPWALSAPPKKIACGFHHSVAISNVQGRSRGRAEAFAWGRNEHGALGLGLTPSPRSPTRRLQQRQEIDATAVPTQVTFVGSDIYEVSCGVSHTVFLKKRPSDAGGVVFAAGLGTRGRLGVRRPGGGDPRADMDKEPWCTDGGPVQVKFPWASGTRVLRVACGADHTLCYATDSRLYAFGANDFGQCGVGAPSPCVHTPVRVAELGGRAILHFAAGSRHTVAAHGEDGELWAWGCGANGRLGLGPDAPTCAAAPLQVRAPADLRFSFVAAGEAHSGALDSTGRAFMWGAGSYCRLGLGSDADVLAPRFVGAFAEMTASDADPIRLQSMALGGFHSLFLEDRPANTRLFACGAGPAAGLPPGECGRVRVLGDARSMQQEQIVQEPKDAKPMQQEQIVQVAAGMFHSMALFLSGAIAVWGAGAGFRLGHGTDQDISEMRRLDFHGFRSLEGDGRPLRDQSEQASTQALCAAGAKQDFQRRQPWELAQLACGAKHTAALTEGGLLFVWGCSDHGQLGLGEAVKYSWCPRKLVFANRQVREVAVGYEHCLAVTSGGELWAWGDGGGGQLGLGSARSSATPQRVPSLEGVVSCAAGEVHSAGICRAATGQTSLWTWGTADGGVLGLGRECTSGVLCAPGRVWIGENSKEPPGSESLGPMLVRCGQSHTMVLLSSTSAPPPSQCSAGPCQLWAFGCGRFGRLGLGPALGGLSSAPAPRQVPLRGVLPRDVACGAHHTCLLSKEGDLFAWGRGSLVCEHEDVDTPKRFLHIEDRSKVKFVACGELHTLAITVSGDLWAWGDNRNGQVGLGRSVPESLTPERISLGVPAALAGAGVGHSIVELANGEVFAFGSQALGQLGLVARTSEKVVWEPSKVEAAWASVAATTRATPAPKQRAKDPSQSLTGFEARESQSSAVRGQRLRDIQTAASFPAVQALIQQQDERCRESSLAALEQRLETSLAEFLQEIRRLPEVEASLGRLEKDFDQSVRSNLRWFRTVPVVAHSRGQDPQFVSRLRTYKELLWVLQQQAAYLAALSACAPPSGPDAEAFHSVVERLFESPSDRTRHLFLMALRLMVKQEIESPGRTWPTLFKPEAGSHAFRAFSHYIQSKVHTQIWTKLYLRTEKIAGEPPSLLQTIMAASDLDVFALSFDAYRDMLTEEERKNKDEQDLKAAFSESEAKLRDFLTEAFARAVLRADLPPDVRQLLAHCVRSLGLPRRPQPLGAASSPSGRSPAVGPPVEAEDDGVTEELRPLEPLLRLFLRGLLVPVLRRPLGGAHGRASVVKAGAADLRSSQPLLASNLEVVVGFLEMMADGGPNAKDSSQKMLLSAVRVLKPMLLRYLQQQAEIIDDLEVSILVDVYLTHFSRTKEIVTMPASALMRLSNMLKENMAKLRMKDNDALEALCRDLPEWQPDQIARVASSETLHNFELDLRYLLREPGPPQYCLSSRCVLPAKLCGARYSEKLLRRRVDEDEGGPSAVLHDLFWDLEPLEARDFHELKEEFSMLKRRYEQATPPNYMMGQQLQQGLRIIDDLLNQATRPQDIIDRMAKNALVSRERHLAYLQQAEAGVALVRQRCDQHPKDIARRVDELAKALDASLSLSLPECFTKNAGRGLKRLKFDILRSAAARRALDPATLRKLGATLSPIATYTTKDLKKMRVLVDVHPPFSALEKCMRITVRASPAGVELVIGVIRGASQSTVKIITVPDQQLEEMRRAAPGHVVSLGSPGETAVLTCLCSEFLALVGRLKERTA